MSIMPCAVSRVPSGVQGGRRYVVIIPRFGGVGRIDECEFAHRTDDSG